MKTRNHLTRTRHFLRIVACGLLALTLPTACKKAGIEDQPTTVTVASPLAQDLKGTWVHVGRPGQVRAAPAVGGRLKFRTGSHWTLTRADPDTGLVTEHFGGTYTLEGDEYVETQDYADKNWIKDNGVSLKFTVKVEGDTMTQTGIGNPYTEVWVRAK